VRNAAVAAAMFDRNMCYLAWSDRWLADYRLGARDLSGLSHYQVFPDICPKWRGTHRRCLDGAVEMAAAEPFPRSDGTVDFVRWSSQPWYDDRNEIGGLVIFSEVVTEQRRMQEALMVSESHLSTIFRESPVALSVSDFATGRLLDVNRALVDLMHARSRDELVGKTSLEIGMLHASDRGRLLNAVLEQGRVESFAIELHRLDGQAFPGELFVSSYVEGGRRFLLTSIVDITERKRAEQELAASRARYRALFEGANDAVFLRGLYPDGTPKPFSAVNSIAIERLGYSAEEFQRMTAADIDAGEFAEKRHQALQKLARDGHVTFEMVQIAKDGRRIPVELSARRFLLGDEPHILAIARDLTARKRAEQEIARLATAIEQAVETIVITDANARIVYANPAFEKTSGYTVAEALGQTPNLLKSGKHDDAFYSQMWEVLARGETWRGRMQNKRKDGTLYLEDASISPVRDQSGKVVNYIALKLDVTREAELQAQLMQAQKMESIGRLAGGVAHDFNNLLTVINGYSKMALDGLREGDPLRDQLEEIYKAGERAAALTGQLLAFSRKQILQPRILDLNGVVEDMRRMLERLMGEDIEVRFTFSSQAPVVNADPHQLQQAMMNLAVNARDAMPSGGKLLFETEIVARCERCKATHPDTGPGFCAMVSVSDTGVGMDEATLQRVFEPFYTTKGSGRGTGLGLSIVQGVIAQSGGCIHVNSEPGKGTTFQIYLPVLKGVVPTAAPAAVSSLTGKETILVVEDQVEVRTFTAAALRDYGYRVFEAANAEEAVAICDRSGGGIHLVLTDVVMPRTSGPQLAAKVRLIRPGLKVLFMSGYTDDVISVTGAPNEPEQFILKPFTPDELAGKVRAVLGSEVPGARILVADDEAGVRAFLREALESEAYWVIEASDGKQALRLAHSERVNLVITDLVMPEQEGIETIRALRRQLPGVRIIATSGAFNGQFLAIAKVLGADAVLSKPFSPEALLSKVKEVITSR
jgi:two-component system cell cycle sensor histidine kinase/response regulator CckA